MVTVLLDMVEKAPIVLALVFLVYWLMKWLQEVLPIHETLKQPAALLISTLICAGVLANYNFRPIDLGTPNIIVLDYLMQGALLASLTGVAYDKFVTKRF